MSDITTIIKNELAQGEELISVMDNLNFDISFVPHIKPTNNPPAFLEGTLALTNRRLIAILWDGNVWRWLHIAGLNWYSERFLKKQKPGWPYQAILMIPSGMGLIVQTEKPDYEQATQLL